MRNGGRQARRTQQRAQHREHPTASVMLLANTNVPRARLLQLARLSMEKFAFLWASSHFPIALSYSRAYYPPPLFVIFSPPFFLSYIWSSCPYFLKRLVFVSDLYAFSWNSWRDNLYEKYFRVSFFFHSLSLSFRLFFSLSVSTL